MRALEQMMERQKLMRITERSERMYLEGNGGRRERKTDFREETRTGHLINPARPSRGQVIFGAG